jgi:3',5'-cyclic AMP phosphodiesterase CpdA
VGHALGTVLAGLSLTAAPSAAAATGIVAIGDFGVGGRAERGRGAAVERFASRHQVDALVTLGDNDYTERPAAFRANWRASFGWASADGLVVAGTLGNHDVRVRGGRYEFRLLGMPRRSYTRRVGDVGLFLVDSTRIGDRQLRRLDARLDASTAPWKVVAMHHPAYSCGGYLGDPRVRSLIVPILRRNDVDLVLAGHDHNYQRFAPRHGVTYAVHGGGGTRLYPLRSCPASFPARVAARKMHGWLYLLADADTLRVRSIGPRGGVRDDFTLGSPKPPGGILRAA